jgi:lipid A ethanolaminephosphotransferase
MNPAPSHVSEAHARRGRRWPSALLRPALAFRAARIALTSEQLVLAGAVFFALLCNFPFLADASAGRRWSEPSTWAYAGTLLLMLAALHALLLGLVLHRRLARGVLAVLVVAAAGAGFFMARYHVVMDPSMLRNTLRTDWSEARELLGWDLAGHLLLFAGLPLVALSRVRLVAQPWRRALLARLGLLAGSAAVLVVGLLLVFQDFSAVIRNQRELRYLITPANLVYSAARVLAVDSAVAAVPRKPVGTDAHLGPHAQRRGKPLLFVVVVGETARAANWGLNGYARQTTPELAAFSGPGQLLNFGDVTACGTNTETSLPCMFSAVGRRDYDEQRIRGSESLLHVLDRAGYPVQWIDNQSGCKGVCDGLVQQRIDAAADPALCDGGHCLDEVLLQRLESAARQARGNLVLVLHMLGNHGPAYHQRYPATFGRHSPACRTAELRRCSREEIVNAYDNALTYTDHVLAGAVKFLATQADRRDTGLIYVSDHGESLGENGLYLHGVPYAIAPSQQAKVPMVWWLSPGLAERAGIDRACLAAQATRAWTHDNLFHTTLGLLDVQTAVYERSLDISAPCAH